MNCFKYLCTCELEECKLFFKDPINLPCGSTICQKHVEDCKDTYNCPICKKEHLIPDTGFPINKFAIKTIENGLHLNEEQKKIANWNQKLESIVKEHDSLNSDNLIYDYFSNLRNQVDLHREQLIEQINKRSDEIIKQLKEMEANCKLNSSKLEDS